MLCYYVTKYIYKYIHICSDLFFLYLSFIFFLKKDQPTDPPDFQIKRANKPLIFRPMYANVTLPLIPMSMLF